MSRWMALKVSHQLLALFALLVGLAALAGAANMGAFVRYLATQPVSETAAVFAQSWLTSLQVNELGDIGAITLGGALLAAVFAPFTGTATISLAPLDDLATLRLARLHRYFDSLLVNCFSGIGLIQLGALTAITSVVGMDGAAGITWSLLFAWSIWLAVIALTTALAWSLEWMTRRFGRVARYVMLATASAVIVGLAVRDPYSARNLFGAGDLFSRTSKGLAEGAAPFTPIAVVLAVTAVLFITGVISTRSALNLPAYVAPARTRRIRRRVPLKNPTALTLSLLVATLTRTPETRKPILAVLLVGTPLLALVTADDNVQVTLALTIPLAVSLAWAVNVFGVIGQGMPWLVSQPRLATHMPRLAALIHVSIIVLLGGLLVGVAFARGNISPDGALATMLGISTGAVLSAAVSLRLAIHRPVRSNLTGRGDSLVPPITALGYLMLLLVTASLPAVIVVLGLEAPIRPVGFVIACLIAWVVHLHNESDWRDPARRARVTAAVASN